MTIQPLTSSSSVTQPINDNRSTRLGRSSFFDRNFDPRTVMIVCIILSFFPVVLSQVGINDTYFEECTDSADFQNMTRDVALEFEPNTNLSVWASYMSRTADRIVRPLTSFDRLQSLTDDLDSAVTTIQSQAAFQDRLFPVTQDFINLAANVSTFLAFCSQVLTVLSTSQQTTFLAPTNPSTQAPVQTDPPPNPSTQPTAQTDPSPNPSTQATAQTDPSPNPSTQATAQTDPSPNPSTQATAQTDPSPNPSTQATAQTDPSPNPSTQATAQTDPSPNPSTQAPVQTDTPDEPQSSTETTTTIFNSSSTLITTTAAILLKNIVNGSATHDDNNSSASSTVYAVVAVVVVVLLLIATAVIVKRRSSDQEVIMHQGFGNGESVDYQNIADGTNELPVAETSFATDEHFDPQYQGLAGTYDQIGQNRSSATVAGQNAHDLSNGLYEEVDQGTGGLILLRIHLLLSVIVPMPRLVQRDRPVMMTEILISFLMIHLLLRMFTHSLQKKLNLIQHLFKYCPL